MKPFAKDKDVIAHEGSHCESKTRNSHADKLQHVNTRIYCTWRTLRWKNSRKNRRPKGAAYQDEKQKCIVHGLSLQLAKIISIKGVSIMRHAPNQY